MLSTRFISANTNIHSCLFFLDAALEACQIGESSDFSVLKCFTSLGNLIYSFIHK